MDIYAEITNRIVSEMESGLIPWQKPWVASGGCVSYATGKPYSLLNQMLLGRPGEYATFKQIQQAGGYRTHYQPPRGFTAHLQAFLRDAAERCWSVNKDHTEHHRALRCSDHHQPLCSFPG